MTFHSIWKKVFSRRSAASSARSGRSSHNNKFRPGVEALENRLVPASGSISGHVLQDQTGNGLTADDTALQGVTVKLYWDANHNGILDSMDWLAGSRVSASDGAYSFGKLGAGTYFVRESVASNLVLTAPFSGTSSYTVKLGSGQAATGYDFDNFKKLNTSVVTNVSFTLLHADGTQSTVTNLRGNTKQGDTVVANFTVAAGATATLSLVGYNAPGSSFDANTAGQQTIDVLASGTFGPGQHSLSVAIPDGYYQVDFVMGQAIDHFGQAGSNIFYSAQGRLLSADNGGSPVVAPPPVVPPAVTTASLSGTVLADSYGSTWGLEGATVTLTGTDDKGQPVTLTATTDVNGAYTFSNLQPGTYTLTVTPPGAYTDEYANAGVVDGAASGSAAAGVISGVTLKAGSVGSGYTFVEQQPQT